MAYENLQFGATAWALEFFELDNVAAFERVAKQIQELPFYSSGRKAEVIEVITLMNEAGHENNLKTAREMKGVADGLGMKIRGCGFTAGKPDGKESPYLTSPERSEREEAVARVHRGIESAAALANPGEGVLSGPWHCSHEYLRDPEKEELDRLAGVIRSRIVPHAKANGVHLALEPLRPSETYMPDPGQQTRDLIEKVDSGWFGINGDTVHLAYAQDGGLINTIGMLAKTGRLLHFHLSEHDRRQWGRGDIGVRTKDILDALVDNGYKGPVNLENFCPDLEETANIWVPDKGTPLEVLQNGAKYVREQAGL